MIIWIYVRNPVLPLNKILDKKQVRTVRRPVYKSDRCQHQNGLCPPLIRSLFECDGTSVFYVFYVEKGF